jgi:hypothetical protein
MPQRHLFSIFMTTSYNYLGGGPIGQQHLAKLDQKMALSAKAIC